MSHDRNIVRDRTLVLRVMVPGLHTSLNDKINSKKEDDSSSSSAAATSAPSGSHRMSADQLSNLDGVTCLPSSTGSTLWHFRCDGATYPARLVNLPCPVEVHKTFDHANYHKAADVGQMLIVYEDEYAMEEAENEKGYKVEGFPSYYHSGLTPPMRRVVQRRFLSRFEERDTKPIPPPKSEVLEVETGLQALMAKLSTGKGKQKRSGAPSNSGKDKVVEEVEEEIVDYEPWMGNGGKFTIDDAKMHPEWWLSKAEMKEIEATRKVQAVEEEEKRLKEQEAAEAQAEAEKLKRAEAERKSMEKAERKKKKREKKKKQKQEEEEEQQQKEDAAGGPKKGIASLKNQANEEIDEVTAAAMTINEGIEGDEDFLFAGGDDMFDFDNEDITDLL